MDLHIDGHPNPNITDVQKRKIETIEQEVSRKKRNLDPIINDNSYHLARCKSHFILNEVTSAIFPNFNEPSWAGPLKNLVNDQVVNASLTTTSINNLKEILIDQLNTIKADMNTIKADMNTMNNNLTTQINTINVDMNTMNNNLTTQINTIKADMNTMNNNLTTQINTINADTSNSLNYIIEAVNQQSTRAYALQIKLYNENARSKNSNFSRTQSNNIVPILKEIQGIGNFPGLVDPNYQPENADIGSKPTFFPNSVADGMNMQVNNICRFATYYNENFGITEADSESIKKMKFWSFLTGDTTYTPPASFQRLPTK